MSFPNLAPAGLFRSAVKREQMDGASIGTAIAITVGLIVLSIVGCCGICCCCFAIPLFKLIGGLFSPSSNANVHNNLRTRQQDGQGYELVGTTSGLEAGYQGNGRHTVPSAPPSEDVIVAEAYLIPPLAEVHTINADQIIGGDDSMRLQELHVETTEHKDGGFQDVWAAVLFVFNIAVIVYFAVQSIYLLKVSPHSTEESSTAEEDSQRDWKILEVIAAFTLILTVCAGAVGTWVLSFLMNHSENLIEMVMWGSIGIQGVCAVLCLISLQLLGAVIFAVLAGLNYWYLLSVRPQIPFASAVLATACTAVKENYTGLVTTAFSALFVQMVWVFLWVVALVGILYSTQNTSDGQDTDNHARILGSRVDDDHFRTDTDPTDSNNNDDNQDGSALLSFCYFLLAVSLYWGIQVIKSVVQVTVAGTLACWWFQPQRPSPVRGSLFRALTTSFGSICFGSLIVAVIQALREVLHGLRRRALSGRGDRNRSAVVVCLQGMLLMVLEFLMDLLEQAVRYFNKYAFCYVAAYGLSFVKSGRLVTSLFTNRGWTAIINDNLISRALLCGVLALTVGNMICGVVLSFVFDLFVAKSTHDMGMLALIGGLVGAVAGLIVGSVLSNALDSAVAMVFVCFAEDPLALQKNHPETYEVLRARWAAIHPDTLTWCHAAYGGGSGNGGGSSGPSPVRIPVAAATHGAAVHGQARPYAPAVVPVTGGVGSTGHGSNSVGVVYPAPGQVIYQGAPVPAPPLPHAAQPVQYQAPNVYNPYNASSYTSPAGYGGYSGYGGGASYGSGGYGTGAGAQGSPSNIYNPNYNGANYYATKTAQDASKAQYAPPMHSPVHGTHQGPAAGGQIPVAQPAPDRSNPPPSAPPGYY